MYDEMDISNAIMDAVLSVLSSKIDNKALRKINTKNIRKKLYEKITNEVFYLLLKEEKINLPPGFGTVFIRGVREKEKKIYNKKEKAMITHNVRGKKVVYRPGQIIKQFL